MNEKIFNKNFLGEILIPEKIYKLDYRKRLEKLYEKTYFNNLDYRIIANLFALSMIINFALYLYLYPTIRTIFNNYINSSFFGKFMVIFATWFTLNLIIYYGILLFFFFYYEGKFKKAEVEIEKNLPEFLDNLLSNLKGGIALEKALLKSVRKEQKALLKEVTLINERILMGSNVTQALKEFRNRFNSPIINRTFFLIEESLRGGSNLAAPLERISKNLKKIYQLNDEIKANSGGFSVVISAISMLVAPLLFALAITLLSFISDLFKLLSKGGTEFLAVSEIPPEFSNYLVIFSYAMIILITFFSSLITSQLKNEETFEAIKYVPIYIIIALFLYIQMSDILLGFFGGIIA